MAFGGFGRNVMQRRKGESGLGGLQAMAGMQGYAVPMWRCVSQGKQYACTHAVHPLPFKDINAMSCIMLPRLPRHLHE